MQCRNPALLLDLFIVINADKTNNYLVWFYFWKAVIIELLLLILHKLQESIINLYLHNLKFITVWLGVELKFISVLFLKITLENWDLCISIGGNNPLQYSCLENPMDRGTWLGYSPWGREESDTTKQLHSHQLKGGPKDSVNGRKYKKENTYIYVCIYLNHFPAHMKLTQHSVCMCVCLVAKSCLTLCDPMDYSLPDSSVLGISQTKRLEWVAISFSRGSAQPRNWTCISCIAVDSLPLSHWGNPAYVGQLYLNKNCF